MSALLDPATCGLCDVGAAEYRCDECGRNYCDDCAPHREDDAPVDVCLDCCLPFARPRAEQKTVDESPSIGDTAPQ
jgi:ribosome-binding protein aMBF1 (putative translation factor)